MVTPAKLGHRAAAQGYTDCPFPLGSADADAWYEATQRVEAFRTRGLDPDGHTAPPPHLCPRDTKAVCNCCHMCTMGCRSEEPAQNLTVDRVMWAIVRIATALERRDVRGFSVGDPCSVCGSVVKPKIIDGQKPKAVCSVCAAAM